MFDIGMQELIVVFIVILLVFGPKRAPELGRTVGKALAELKKSFQDVKKQVETEFKESTSDIQEARKSFEDLRKKVEKGVKETVGINALQQPVKDIIEETDEAEEEEEEEEEGEEGEEEEEEKEEAEEKEKEVKKEEQAKEGKEDKEIQPGGDQKKEGLNDGL
ncbi:MAG TPA: Sec-independent protein translocase protein TatB [Thermodesulfovibrionales bacterium]|nr:Sec-independent protein translocase protein TatB [Thermodesulfovibrionales bacterium]